MNAVRPPKQRRYLVASTALALSFYSFAPSPPVMARPIPQPANADSAGDGDDFPWRTDLSATDAIAPHYEPRRAFELRAKCRPTDLEPTNPTLRSSNSFEELPDSSRKSN